MKLPLSFAYTLLILVLTMTQAAAEELSPALKNNQFLDTDGSCQLQIFNCTDVVWFSCTKGVGTGTCINPLSDENCSLRVLPDDSYNGYHCRRFGGCGFLDCGCQSQKNCTCSANWGICEFLSGAYTEPYNCIPGGAALIPVDPRCENLNPTTASPSKNLDETTMGLIIGLPVGAFVLVASTITVVGVVLCYVYHRKGYETLDD